MDRQSLPGILMVVWCPLQILCDTASRSLLARAHAGNPSDLTPTARVLEAIMRRTLLPRLGYREGLTRIQLWLLNALM